MTKKNLMIVFITVLLVACGNGETNEESRNTVNNEQMPSTSEKKEKNQENSDGMPYISPENIDYSLGSEDNVFHPWKDGDLLESVIKLEEKDMKGKVTFINGDVYSFIDGNGMNDKPAKLGAPNEEPKKVDLYMAKTEATKKLKVNDVIALAGVRSCSFGAIQKIVSIEITNEVVHIVAKCPKPEEMLVL